MIDRWRTVTIDRCSNIWASLPGAGYGQFEHKADSLIAKFRHGRNGQRDWCMSRVTAIISALVICIIVCLSWAVNHYRITPLPTKPSDKNARELKLANAAITDMQMRQRDVAALDAKYTKELADAKAENDALRDDVAAGRRRLHIKAKPVSVSVKLPAASGVDNAASPTGRHRWTGLFHPQRGWSLCKNNWKEPRSILMSSR